MTTPHSTLKTRQQLRKVDRSLDNVSNLSKPEDAAGMSIQGGAAEAAGQVTLKESRSGEGPDERKTAYDSLFEGWDKADFVPEDWVLDVAVGSLEASVGYSSLFRQMHQSFVREVAFYKSPQGGSLSTEEARSKAFHACDNAEEAKRIFSELMALPLERLNFVDLLELHSLAPRVAERFWEMAKAEGAKEFASGHLGANISFPAAYMKQLWNIARYIGVRDAFIEDWKPSGAIEVSLIDMLTQAYFQYQYWLEQTVKRSQTRERAEHPEYTRFMAARKEEFRVNGWSEGHWDRPYVTEQQAIEHAVQMADRWHRMYMRTLRQLRDLRRYSPVTITNAGQVNIASDGGANVNVNQ